MKNPLLVEQWLSRAQSNLDRARAGKICDTILYEDLYYDCQQAVEKSLKSLLIAHDKVSPHTHIIARLLETLETEGIAVPDNLKPASDLTEYAVHTRYPGLYEPVIEDDYREALATAELIHAWVISKIRELGAPSP